MQNFDQDLLNIIDMGKKLVKEFENPTDPFHRHSILLSLMRIEKILDTGRTLLTEEQMPNLRPLNKGMDELRNEIYRLKQTMDTVEYTEMLRSAADDFKTRYI